MAKSLEEYINELKNQHKASGKGSLDWYLEQVRALAAKRLPESEEKTKPKEQISSADALQGSDCVPDVVDRFRTPKKPKPI